MVIERVVSGIRVHPWRCKLRRHSKALVRVSAYSCLKRSTVWWLMGSEGEVGPGPRSFVVSLPMNVESIQASDRQLVTSSSDAKPWWWWWTRQKDMKSPLRQDWRKEIPTVLEGRSNGWAQAEKETGQRFESSLVKVSWCKSEPFKIVWEGPRNPPDRAYK